MARKCQNLDGARKVSSIHAVTPLLHSQRTAAADSREPPESKAHFDATRMYLNEIGFSPLLSAEEEVYYSRLAQKGDDSGRRRMIESNLRLVVKIARRYINRGLALLDLIEETLERTPEGTNFSFPLM